MTTINWEGRIDQGWREETKTYYGYDGRVEELMSTINWEERREQGWREETKIYYRSEDPEEEFMSTIDYINERGQSKLFDILIAANGLHIQWLIDMTIMESARKMENKTPPIGVEEWSVRNIRSDCKAVKEEFIAHIKEDVHGESRDTNKWSISDKWFWCLVNSVPN